MAVEIPVVIDIEKAFKDAAKRVNTAIKPLQEYMDKNALQIRLHIDDKTMVPVRRILDDSTLSAKQLKTALADIDAQITKRAAAGGFDLTKGLRYSEKIMLQVVGALEHKINGVNDASAVMTRILSVNMDRAKLKVAELTAKIDELTRKQNQYDLAARKGSKGGALNSANTKKRIDEANAALKAAKLNLSTIEVELNKITTSGKRATSATVGMKTAAMEMAESWRRGAEHVERYNASLSTAGSRMGMLIKNALRLVALHSAMTFIRNVREVTSEFEMQRVALGGIIQDTEMAEDLFKRIKAAAIKSPFEIKDLVTYTKQLSAYRIETDKLFDVTMRLADVSAGLGVDMNRLILAYGQVRAASVLRGQELRQFTEAGIPLVELLAEKFQELGREGTTTADVFKLISERAVPFKMIEEIFNDMTDAGGIFYKMQEKQSETLKGKWMKLKDAVSIMYDEIGNTGVVHKGMEDIMNYSMKMMQNWRSVGKTISSAVIAIVAYKVAIANARVAANALTAAEIAETSAMYINTVGRSKLIATLFGEAAATKTQIALGKAYVAVKTKEMVATNLFTQSLYRMIAAMLANPYALAAAGIAVLIGALVRMVSKADEAKITVEGLNKTIESFDSTRDASVQAERLASTYDELKNKTERSVEEQKKLDDITKQLAKTFPSAISGVNEFGTAVELNTEKIREMARVEQEAMYGKLLSDQEEAERELAMLAYKRRKLAESIEIGTYETRSRGGLPMIVGYTDKEMEDMREELVSTIKKYNDLSAAVDNAKWKTNEFYEGVMMNGPSKPEFLGDAWKTAFQDYTVTVEGATEASRVFSDDQIRNADSLYSILEDAAKAYKDYKEKYDQYALSYANATTVAAKEQLLQMMGTAKVWMDGYYKILQDYNALGLIKKSGGTKSHQQDPFIEQLKERMKFMQDFKKGYDDLRKYLESSDALKKESELMMDRGLALGISAEDQKRAASDLSKWYEDMLNEAFSKAKKHGATGSMSEFLSKEIVGSSDQAKSLKEFQKFMQSLWDAKTDLDVSEMKKTFKEALTRVENEMKQSEVARNFYQNILGLTGDEELSQNLAVSVYGDPGADIGARIKESIEGALDSLKIAHDSDLGKKLLGAAETLDFHGVLADIDSIPEEIRNVVKTAASSVEKYNMDIANSYAKLLMQYDEIKQQQVNIANKAAQDIEAIEKGLSLELLAIAKKQISDEEKVRQEEQARARAKSAKEAVAREKALEMSRLERDYRMFFSSIGVISDESARRIARTQKKMLTEQFEKGEISLAKFKRELREVDEQMKKYETSRGLFGSYLSGGIEGLTGKFNEYADSLRAISHNIQVGGGKSGIFSLDDETMSYIDKIGMIMGGKAFGVDGVSGRKNVADQLVSALMAASKNADEFKEKLMAAIDYAAEGADSFASSFASGMSTAGFWVHNVSTLIKELDVFNQDALKTPKWLDAFASTVTWTLGVGGDEAWDRLANLNEYATSGFEKLSQGNIVGAIADNVRGLIDFWGPNIKKINRQLKEQDDTVEGLEYQYNRLENSIQKAFGSDYIVDYNKQLDALYAKQAAYEEQARLEESKEKKKDLDKIKEYENAARDVGDQILDMKGQLAEFFTGTDITSAAKDFATAWIDAYKEFGSTTDAMKDKFNEMIQHMIENSLAAKIMQEILSPLFKQIDDLAADSELSGADIAEIATAAPEYIEKINAAMVTLMNGLNAAGYNVRQQPGQFTGIKRNIANATEESVNGLTQAMNVNNFYMSHIPAIDANVAQILAIMTGGTAENPATGASYQLNSDQVLQYMSALPNIDQNIAELLRYVKSVISDKNSSSNINVVAVRA